MSAPAVGIKDVELNHRRWTYFSASTGECLLAAVSGTFFGLFVSAITELERSGMKGPVTIHVSKVVATSVASVICSVSASRLTRLPAVASLSSFGMSFLLGHRWH